jgi:ribonucleoside-diphosphate reductase beta chain
LNIERIYYRITSSKFDRYECCLDDTIFKFVADRLLNWVVWQRIQYYKSIWFYGYDFASGKTNFFEKKVAEYQKSGVMNTDGEAQKISFDADF